MVWYRITVQALIESKSKNPRKAYKVRAWVSITQLLIATVSVDAKTSYKTAQINQSLVRNKHTSQHDFMSLEMGFHL